MSSSADRLTAARLLIRVEDGAFASRLLERSSSPGIRVRVLGVLRWQRMLDQVLGAFSKRPVGELDAEVRVALRLGLFEASQLEVPSPVATDGAVRLVRELGRTSCKGLVNAVLRRSTNRWREELADVAPDVRLSHPEWLVQRWREHFGEAAAEAMMRANQEPAETWAWWFEPGDRARLLDRGVEMVAHPWCPDAWAAPGRARELMIEVTGGRAYVQDPSSQLVAVLGSALAPDGGRLVDLCAAPGGKLARLLGSRAWSAAVATDLRLGRTRLVRELCRQRVGAPWVCGGDASTPPLRDRSWDLVLLDAPCSGSGVLRRHPELRWRIAPEVIAERAEIQRALLSGALGLVAAGGVLLYSTCSVEPEENEELVAELEQDVVVQSLDEVMPDGVPWSPTPAGGARILPCPDGDGFTVHALRRPA